MNAYFARTINCCGHSVEKSLLCGSRQTWNEVAGTSVKEGLVRLDETRTLNRFGVHVVAGAFSKCDTHISPPYVSKETSCTEPTSKVIGDSAPHSKEGRGGGGLRNALCDRKLDSSWGPSPTIISYHYLETRVLTSELCNSQAYCPTNHKSVLE